MKTFTTSGTGNQQTLSPIETDKIPVYDSVTDAEADLANLAENQIIATHDTGSELSAPTDTIQSGNMHAVTSNAVHEAMQAVTTYTGEYCTAYKVGRVCTLMCYYRSTSVANSPLTVDTLPVAFRPITNIRAGLTFTSNDTYAGNLFIQDSGEVILYHESGTQFLANSGYGFSTTYITAN